MKLSETLLKIIYSTNVCNLSNIQENMTFVSDWHNTHHGYNSTSFISDPHGGEMAAYKAMGLGLVIEVSEGSFCIKPVLVNIHAMKRHHGSGNF